MPSSEIPRTYCKFFLAHGNYFIKKKKQKKKKKPQVDEKTKRNNRKIKSSQTAFLSPMRRGG